ncbi:uncharacterized protein LOC110974910 isoform X2 [Acanthaster planci]|uniref:Uncharacterized protein LOC110974910 isoform X2 n=1 Tax=Acanthaster planci TaxID=133434 RepID=A0A8B7XQV9_ACAPL|nr:uncharacterized protein LOC110974910 isoform X2 [Acanthaster planci]
MAARSHDSGVSLRHNEKNDNYEETDMTEDDETAEDDNDVPVVLQCKNCNNIVGDSMAWVCANDDLKTITLHSITNSVTAGKKLMTSTTEGIDLGSYQIGSGQQRASVGLQDMLDLPTAKSLKDSILKTQVMICALNNRILNIENALELKEDAEEPADIPASGHYNTPNDQDNTAGGMNSHIQTKKLSNSQQDLTAAVSSIEEKESSGTVKKGKQFIAGKRSKETSTATGNKRSRFK